MIGAPYPEMRAAMNVKSRVFLALLLSCWSLACAADAYYTGNPVSPYPPGCITSSLRDLDLTGENVAQFFSDRIWLETAHQIGSTDPFANLGEVQLDMYRVGCAEINRSVIIAEFTLPPEWVDPRNAQIMLPWLGGSTGMDPVPFEFKSEMNSGGGIPGQPHFLGRAFGDYTGGWDDPRRFSWRYVLDLSSLAAWGDRDGNAEYYNGVFGLEFYRSNGRPFLAMLVPSTEDLLEPLASMPLGGRLSGNWVEKGSADQGLLISFSTPLMAPGATTRPEESDLLVFLSWFTFDAHGELLWLTGAARFAQGSSVVDILIERVTQGAFLDSTPAQRATVGSARLSAFHCNRLELEYELGELGLGSGVMQLQRLLALEIADYPCRDYEGLQASIYPPEPY